MAPLGPSIRWCNSLLLFAASNRDKTNDLATKLDIELIARLEIEHCGESLSDQKVSVALNLGVQQSFVESSEAHRLTTVFLVRDLSAGSSKVRLRDITQVFHLGEQFGTGKQ